MTSSGLVSSVRNRFSGLALAGGWQFEFGRFAAIILVVSSIALIWSGIWFKHNDEIRNAEAAAQQHAQTLARSLEEQLRRTLGAVDQTLFYVRDTYTRTPNDFNLAEWQQNGRYLGNSAFQVSVVDHEGFVLSSNLGTAGSINISDREHFKVHLEKTTDQLFISKPVFGRLSQKWSIQLSRRMVFPDGRFAGVIVGAIDPVELSKFYATVRIGRGGSVLLIGDDGYPRARSPFDPAMFSQNSKGTAVWNQRLASKDGNFVATSIVDGTRRLYASRAIEGFGLTLVIGQSFDDVYKTAGVNSYDVVIAGVLATLWVLAFLMVITAYQKGLARSRDQAEAGTRARTEFLTTMSHEIRTPLNGVIGLAELLSSGRLDAEQQKIVGTLKESAAHLLLLLNDVLDFSKLDADRLELEQVEFSIEEIARSTVDMLRVTARNKGIVLALDIAPTVPAVLKGDPGRIRQILLNLIGNGIKFTEKGHVWLSVSGAAREVAPGYQLQLRVVDTGCGIAPGQLKRLFSSFSQADSSISRRYGGTGLGLAISQRLAARMGGGIVVFSEHGKGSTFEVSLHTEAVASTAVQVERPTSAPQEKAGEPGRRLSILLAEDNRTNQFVIGQILRQLGQDVEIVADGAQALAAVQKKTYDLVLMDVMMPEMDGVAATKAIRALNGPASAVLISALTANSLDSDKAACLAAGMNMFLTKPVTRRMLETLLDEINLPPSVSTPLQAPEEAPRELSAGQQAPLNLKALASASARDGRAFGPAAYQELVRDLGEAMAQEIMRTFLEETDEYLDQLFESVAEQNRNQLMRVAHSLKGSAQTVGFGAVSDLARLVEINAEYEAVEALQMRVESLAVEYRTLRACVQPMQQVA